MELTEQDIQRFYAKVQVNPLNIHGCHLWTGALNSNGYGEFWLAGNNARAHRIAYELYYNEKIPKSSIFKQIDHICKTPKCVNPLHLRLVSPKENVLSNGGPSARNAARTHCKHGHEFTPENTRILKGNRAGHRECKECKRIKDRKRIRLFRKR